MKKIKRIYPDKIFLNLKYSWEILRRRKDYKKDFNKFVSVQTKKLSKSKSSLIKSLDFNDIQIYDLLDQATKDYFKNKYLLGLPLNYEIAFEDLGLGKISDCEKNQKDWALVLKASLFKHFAFYETGFGFQDKTHPYAVSLLTKKPWNDDFVLKNTNKYTYIGLAGNSLKATDIPDKISIEIDLKLPIEIIKPAIEALVSEFKEVRKRLGADKYEHRTRYDKFDIYFKIFDLDQKGKSLRQIAQIVYKTDYDKIESPSKYNILHLTEKVKNNLKAAQKIINHEDFKIIG